MCSFLHHCAHVSKFQHFWRAKSNQFAPRCTFRPPLPMRAAIQPFSLSTIIRRLYIAANGVNFPYPVFIIDPHYMEPNPTAFSPGSSRAGLLLQSLVDLDLNLKKLGSCSCCFSTGSLARSSFPAWKRR